MLAATLSKAAGGYGGIIPGTHAFVAALKAASHWYDGASPLPPAVAAATAQGLQLLLAEPELRAALARNVQRMKDGLRRLGLAIDQTPVPIIGLALGDADAMRRLQRELMRQGFLIAYLAAYAGVGPQGVLRLAVFADHTPAMIDEFLDRFSRLL
jgi:7-keto-8-aminopelargonate synthetase-like enzyme